MSVQPFTICWDGPLKLDWDKVPNASGLISDPVEYVWDVGVAVFPAVADIIRKYDQSEVSQVVRSYTVEN